MCRAMHKDITVRGKVKEEEGVICGNICSSQPYQRGFSTRPAMDGKFWRRLLAETPHKDIWIENSNTETLIGQPCCSVLCRCTSSVRPDIFMSPHRTLSLMFYCLAKDLLKLCVDCLNLLDMFSWESQALCKTDSQNIIFIASLFPQNTALLTSKKDLI